MFRKRQHPLPHGNKDKRLLYNRHIALSAYLLLLIDYYIAMDTVCAKIITGADFTMAETG